MTPTSQLQIVKAVDLLAQVFPGLTGPDYMVLVESSRIREHKPGIVLCHEGEVEDVFYVIMSGLVEVSQALDKKERRVLKTLTANDFFGEMALIRGVPRAATVRTVDTTLVLEIDQRAFETVLYRSPVMAITMLRAISSRITDNDQLTIDEFRAKNDKLASAYNALAEQERLRSEFLTTVSHELRTPLTSMKGYLHLLRVGAIQGEALTGALDTVNQNLATIISLVNDILFLQEMEAISPQFTQIDLATLIANAAEANRERAARASVTLQLSAEPGLPPVSGNAEGLSRVFYALIDNAIKFSPLGGEVQIAARVNQNAVEVSVRDTGVGITADHMPKIFDRFFHTDEVDGHRFGGVGLGLAIAKYVVEQHRGKISASSDGVSGHGAQVVVSLPVP